MQVRGSAVFGQVTSVYVTTGFQPRALRRFGPGTPLTTKKNWSPAVTVKVKPSLGKQAVLGAVSEGGCGVQGATSLPANECDHSSRSRTPLTLPASMVRYRA